MFCLTVLYSDAIVINLVIENDFCHYWTPVNKLLAKLVDILLTQRAHLSAEIQCNKKSYFLIRNSLTSNGRGRDWTYDFHHVNLVFLTISNIFWPLYKTNFIVYVHIYQVSSKNDFLQSIKFPFISMFNLSNIQKAVFLINYYPSKSW